MANKNPVIVAAIIGALAVVIAAVIGAILQPSWWQTEPHPKTDLVIAGTVVDQKTNQGMGQAILSIAGRAETYVTEDNGNFRIELHGGLKGNASARLHISKEGYVPYDGTVEPPTESLIVPMRRM